MNNFGRAVIRRAKHAPRGCKRNWLVHFHSRTYTYDTWDAAVCAGQLLSRSYLIRPVGLVGAQYNPDRKA